MYVFFLWAVSVLKMSKKNVAQKHDKETYWKIWTGRHDVQQLTRNLVRACESSGKNRAQPHLDVQAERTV